MDDRLHDGFLSPQLRGRANPTKGGFGVYAVEPVAKGATLGVWGGSIVNLATLRRMAPITVSRTVQVDDDWYLVSRTHDDPADFFNHSCEPNAGMSDQIVLVAMRDIQRGEEVCFDYAMTDGSPYDEFECQCKTHSCRGRITANDWMIAQLHLRYLGYFSPYLQRRIARWHAARLDCAAAAPPTAVEPHPDNGHRNTVPPAHSRNGGPAR